MTTQTVERRDPDDRSGDAVNKAVENTFSGDAAGTGDMARLASLDDGDVPGTEPGADVPGEDVPGEPSPGDVPPDEAPPQGQM